MRSMSGVISSVVAQRTREIGIRVALGARPSDVAWMINGNALKLVGVGVAIGLGGALAAAQLIKTMLFEVHPADFATFAGIPLLLAAAALATAFFHARRATRISPMTALNRE